MYSLQMNLCGLNKFHEMLPGELEGAELMLEEVSSLILLDLFDEVIADDVTLRYGRIACAEGCSISLRFFCPACTLKTRSWSIEELKSAVEEQIGCALGELFGKVIVENVTIRWESEQENTLLRSA
ncbi:MAG TPA: hypothetical protein VNE61_14480 [Ktedonobacteraceae bacterium]|nr:hypothetical protein [Ktedonobacteraceae bacterium]